MRPLVIPHDASRRIVQSAAARVFGELVRRGPYTSVSQLAVSMTCERLKPSSRMREMAAVSTRSGACACATSGESTARSRKVAMNRARAADGESDAMILSVKWKSSSRTENTAALRRALEACSHSANNPCKKRYCQTRESNRKTITKSPLARPRKKRDSRASQTHLRCALRLPGDRMVTSRSRHPNARIVRLTARALLFALGAIGLLRCADPVGRSEE